MYIRTFPVAVVCKLLILVIIMIYDSMINFLNLIHIYELLVFPVPMNRHVLSMHNIPSLLKTPLHLIPF